MKDIAQVKDNKSSKNIGYIISVLCFISNLSQLPIFIGVGVIKIIIMISWILLFCYIIFSSFNKLFIRNKTLLISTALFDILIVIFSIFTGENYLVSNMIYPLHLCLYIYYVANFCGQLVDSNVIYKISNYYIVSALIVAVYIYFDIFNGVNWASSMGYLYASKNSIAQIFLVAIMLLLLFYKKSNLFKWGQIFFLTAMLFMLKSRTTLLGFTISLLYIIFYVIEDKKMKRWCIFFILVTVSFVLTNDTAFNLIVNNILLNNRSGIDYSLDDISSGRLTHVDYFINNFRSVMFIGTGGTYLESFPLAALMSYGIIGSIPLFVFVIYPIIVSYLYRNEKTLYYWRYLIILLSAIMLFNGVFEELSPLGPGVKNYMLWLIVGLYTGIVNKKIGNHRNG
jgi:hypothetical protein